MTDELALPPPLPSPPVPARPVKRWRWWAHLLLLLPYPLLIGLAASARSETRGAALTGGWKSLLIVCSIELAIFGALFGLALGLSKATRDDLLLRLRRPGLTVLLGLAYSAALRIGIGIVVLLIGVLLVMTKTVPQDSLLTFVKNNRPDVETVVNVKALAEDPVYFWLTLTFVSFIVAGLREELWRSGSLAGLRKVWPRAFGSRYGEFAAVAVTSLVFGLGHLPQGLLAVGITALLGMALGSIMVAHRSLWTAVIAHGAFDATSFALIPLAMEAMKKM